MILQGKGKNVNSVTGVNANLPEGKLCLGRTFTIQYRLSLSTLHMSAYKDAWCVVMSYHTLYTIDTDSGVRTVSRMASGRPNLK